MWMSFSVSPSSSRSTGMPVHRATTEAMSSSSTSSLTIGSPAGSRPLLELALERGQLAVADLGDALEVARPLGALGLHPQLVDPARDLLDAVELPPSPSPSGPRARRAPRAPRRARARRARAPRRSPRPSRRARSRAGVTRRFASSSSSGEESISIRSREAASSTRSIALSGQEAVGDVAVREHRGGDERRVADADAVVRLVALLQPAQDRDRVRDGRLADDDRLEAALERGVLLDVLAVLVERRRADAAELAAGEHRLQQVAGVRRRPRPRPRRRSCAARR